MVLRPISIQRDYGTKTILNFKGTSDSLITLNHINNNKVSLVFSEFQLMKYAKKISYLL
jgi:hypothetical protein